MTLTKTDIADGIARGLVFVQRSYAPSQEKVWVDELITEGKACGFWAYNDGGETTRMVRMVRRKGYGPKEKVSRQWLDERQGTWIWEYPSKPSRFLLRLCTDRPYTVWIGVMLRKMARERALYPAPLTPEFLYVLALNLSGWGQKWRYAKKDYQVAARSSFERIMQRLENPATPVERYNHIVDHLLAWHGLAPLPKIIESKPTPPTKEEAALSQILQDIIRGDRVCAVCGHLPEGDRSAMRDLLTQLPLKTHVCDKCQMAFWTNITGSETRDE